MRIRPSRRRKWIWLAGLTYTVCVWTAPECFVVIARLLFSA